MEIKSITFKVSNVSKSNIRTKDLDIFDIVNPKENEVIPFAERKQSPNHNNKPQKRRILQSSFTKQSKYIGINSFIVSAIKAYSLHHHLVIRVDDIWMAILNQFSIYVNTNSEKLRERFVDFSGKKTLTVVTQVPILDAPLDKLTIQMAENIESNIIDPSIRDWVIPNFSTTTENDRVVYSASLMSTFKSYFDYRYMTFCGLPSVTLQGSVDDWLNLKQRVERLLDFAIIKDSQGNSEMKEWVSMLHPVIDQFISTSMGKPNIEWWNQIADKRSASGFISLTGWITVFCVYDKNGKWIGDKKDIGYDQSINSQWLKVGFDSIPLGYLSTPITLVNYDQQEYKCDLLSGHMTINVEPNDETILKPSLDWAIIY
ncbi:hypothetical protein RB653_002719 [Dictyostelium firmibasis]|uniref:Uncharacterized protein n=1 Tax=Dictyostelium firmibasis TaxID=79012 RepID=A0AAN7YQB9_9MYCE